MKIESGLYTLTLDLQSEDEIRALHRVILGASLTERRVFHQLKQHIEDHHAHALRQKQ